jgi:hypothetical protein
MIQINCTNCKALLQIDDAFAGGVCRCRHCGTIQTVPKHLRNANGDGEGVPTTAEATVGSGKPAKTLYQKKRASVADPGGAGSGTGLDDLAGIVASSGLASMRLQKKKAEEAAAAGPAAQTHLQQSKALLIAGSAGGVIAVLIGIIIYMAFRDHTGGEVVNAGTGGGTVQTGNRGGGGGGGGGSGGSSSTATGNTNTQSVSPPVVVPQKAPPNFLGQPLNENSIAYVLDRGAASQTDGRLDLMKQALLRSLRTLGPDRKFAVIFWYIEGTKPVSYPPNGLKAATPENIAELQKLLDDVYPVGQTKMSASVEKAFKAGAEAVVLVPIKALVDENFHPQLMSLRTKAKAATRVYCLTLGQPDIGGPLKKIATDTNGAYRDVSLGELRAAAGQ